MPSPAPPTVRCAVAAWAAVTMTAEQFPTLRRQPGPAPTTPLSPALLKHADPQTVASLAAVLKAIDVYGLKDLSFRDWGVVAGPSLLGRQVSAESILRFRQEGAFAISPHLIPHQSLHAVSGVVSQVLGLHGPNFGVGGGPGAADEALLVAATMLATPTLPGLWLILTDVDPELIPETSTETSWNRPPWICHAVALALLPAGSFQARDYELQLVIAPPARGGTEVACSSFAVAELGAALPPASGSPRSWRLRGGGRLLVASAAAAENLCV